jgi:hypothetical protein
VMAGEGEKVAAQLRGPSPARALALG